ncbi:MAG: DUF5050 domain-containing protein [Anaerolineales bacterium]|nr:DUF5050 domain-containing protein [Anaerolineales bacterium]
MYGRAVVGFGLSLMALIASGCTSSSTVAIPTDTPKTIKQPAPTVANTVTPPEGPPVVAATLSATPVSSVPQPRPEDSFPLLSAGQAVTITHIHMLDASRGWAIGNARDTIDHILYTEDGGITWRDTSPPEPGPSAEENVKRAEAFFLDAETAWISYAPHELIWRTENQGASWEPARVGIGGGLGATIWFMDKESGWVMQYLDAGMHHVYMSMYRTTTGGAYWEGLFDPYTGDELQSFDKTGIFFADANTGWVTRDSGGVQPGAFVDVTYDGGFTWESLPLPPPEDNPSKFDEEYCGMHYPTMLSRSSGSLVVRCKRFDDSETILSHYVYSTSDGGQTWSYSDYPGGELQFIDPSVAYALGREIYLSRDGGRTWTKVKEVNWDGQFSFVSENLAWAVARAGDEIALVRTQDGSRTWEELKPQVAATPVSSLVPTSTPLPEGAVPTPLGGGSGQIAFISYRGIREADTTDIYLMNTDGSGLTLLTDVSGHIENFTWSPDGERIAFDSYKDGDTDIYVINVDGSGLLRLTNDPAHDTDPAWSPDGSRILFVSNREGTNAIYTMNVDGSQTQRLADGWTPSWSPDGSKVLFSRTFDGIYVMNADGTNEKRLTDSSEHGWDWYPLWSPDGTRILFASNRQNPGDALTDMVYVMNSDGTGMGQLTFSGWGMPPWAWSPDGMLIAFTQGFGSGAKLYLMDAKGIDQWPLMDNNQGLHPQWRP